MITLSECKEKSTCYDCKNERCWKHGSKEADCPKYYCDRSDEFKYDCEHCAFIDGFIADMRKEYSDGTTVH